MGRTRPCGSRCPVLKAVTLVGTGGPEVLRYEGVPDPVPTGTQVVVKVEACGVCGHDSANRAGVAHAPIPGIPGHEIAGEIVEVGSAVRGFSVGQRVAHKQFHTCGHCLPCGSVGAGQERNESRASANSSTTRCRGSASWRMSAVAAISATNAA